jgi:hypothetical protein
MKIFICLFTLTFISCNQKANSNIDLKSEVKVIKNNTPLKQEISIIELPFNSNKLNYSNKDKNGYFIYDNSFIKQGFSMSSKTIGVYKNDDVDTFLVELKPNGDEHTEPIVSLFTYKKDKKVDSLIVYETIEWES